MTNMENDHNTGVGCYLDVETTGTSHKDEIIEIAICLFKYCKNTYQILDISETYVGLREPGVAINPFAYAVHKIKMDDLIGKQLNNLIIEAMLNKAEFIIAHNCSFDKRFVTKLFPFTLNKPWLCSMRHINWKSKGFPNSKLQDLLRLHNIKVNRAHRAQDDVLAAIELISLRGLQENDKTYFHELIQNGGKR